MKYSSIAQAYEKIEETTKRLEKTFIISKFLKTVSGENLKQTILLLQGKVFPQSDERKIGVASRLVLKAISQATVFITTHLAFRFQVEDLSIEV